MQKKRVLIVCLDGFTWRLGHDLMATGVMPHLAEAVQTGGHGDLESVTPAETAPAWSSFQTGCLPGKTGVFAFHTYERKTQRVRLNSFRDIAVLSLWELASAAGKTIVSLNLPITSPPPQVRGIVVPGLLCPELSKSTVHPASAYTKYIKPHSDYAIVNDTACESACDFSEQCAATERTRCEIAVQMMQDVDWDVFCFHVQSSDLLQHRLWGAIDPATEGVAAEERADILAFYKCCDNIIGRLMLAAGKEALTIILSDHGFCQAKGAVHVNAWLRKNGYLNLSPVDQRSRWGAIKGSITPLRAMARLAGPCLKACRTFLRNRCCALGSRKARESFSEVELRHLRQLVDFQNTRAFSLGGMAGMLYVNAEGEGRADLCRSLSEGLLRDLGPHSAMPVITRIRPATDVYGHNGSITTIPCLVIEFAEGYSQVINPLGDKVVTVNEAATQKTGTHDSNGVIVLNGPNVKQGVALHGHIVDIAPTILAYLGIAVPRHMDGRILHDAFRQPLQADYMDLDRSNTNSTDYTDEEQAEVERSLMDLGYF